MHRKKTILVIDDEKAIRMNLNDVLTAPSIDHHYEVIEAEDGETGLKMARALLPDLIILDLKLPGIQGLEVCIRLKSDPSTKNIPVMMLTASDEEVEGLLSGGANEFIRKPWERSKLLARINNLFKRMPPPLPYVTQVRECKVSLSLEDRKQIMINTTGKLNMSNRSEQNIQLEVERLIQKGNTIPYSMWRPHVLEIGNTLFTEFFERHNKVLADYRQAVGAVSNAEKLHLRFDSTREFIGVPVECLHDPIRDKFLALHHPLSRSLTGIPSTRPALTAAFLNDLYAREEHLKILLIASNTTAYGLPLIPGVDNEVETLRSTLSTAFGKRAFVEIDVIPTAEASYEVVKAKVKDCQYNIIHYAGHALHNKDFPAESCLIFWEDATKREDFRKVTVNELETWLRNSSVNFFYLSCCSGAGSSGQASQIVYSSFQGIAEGLVQAGVPCVLAFRWPVTDRAAQLIAQTFYESLGRQGHLNVALLEARNQAHIELPNESTWLSPILIIQPD